jgi:hypothetical protein
MAASVGRSGVPSGKVGEVGGIVVNVIDEMALQPPQVDSDDLAALARA